MLDSLMAQTPLQTADYQYNTRSAKSPDFAEYKKAKIK
jgi:hypothetical protein